MGVSAGSQWSHWSERIRGERAGEDPEKLEIWGYTGQPSYDVGESLTLHVSTSVARFGVRIYRDGAEEELVYDGEGTGALHATPPDAFAAGCGWPAAVEIEIPESWRPGAYLVELRARDERGEVVQDAFFVLRPNSPGEERPICVVLATYTWGAYNDWGGASAYSRDPDLRSTVSDDDQGAALRSGEAFSPRLSLERPWARGLIRQPAGAPRMALSRPAPVKWAPRHEYSEWAAASGYSHWSGCAGWAQFDGLFVRWAERRGHPIEVLTQWDLDRDQHCLDRYSCVVTVGHDEYWTADGRRALDGFIEDGGRYARLAGNIFWQIRLEDEQRTQVCYKYVPEQDPLADGEDHDGRTGPFEGIAIDRPPVTTFGASGSRGGYSRFGGSAPRGAGGFIVYRNDHWAFAGADLYYGDVLGASVPLVGYETDGVSYTVEDGLPMPTGIDGAPSDLEILALTPVTIEEEDHGVPGGIVFTGDGDLAFLAQALLGADTPENRDKVRRGSAVITSMRKGSGEVFCGGSTEWPAALAMEDRAVERIVDTVLERFSPR
jgi:hypothetical protein